MERCAEVSKEVRECVYRPRGGYRISRCDTETITQEVCVTSPTDVPIDDHVLNAAIQKWRQITKVEWAIHSLYSYTYSQQSDGSLGNPDVVFWK